MGGMVTTALAQAASLGCNTHILSVLGDDVDGRSLRRSLRAAGIKTGRLVLSSSLPTTVAVILVEQRSGEDDMGGTMRLGAYPCRLGEGTKVAEIYADGLDISERHRHRYEVNIDYKERLEEAGLIFSGMSPDGVLPEIVELRDHPWFVGVQFHPELKSNPFQPHPLFASFIKAAIEQARLV